MKVIIENLRLCQDCTQARTFYNNLVRTAKFIEKNYIN